MGVVSWFKTDSEVAVVGFLAADSTPPREVAVLVTIVCVIFQLTIVWGDHESCFSDSACLDSTAPAESEIRNVAQCRVLVGFPILMSSVEPFCLGNEERYDLRWIERFFVQDIIPQERGMGRMKLLLGRLLRHRGQVHPVP